VLDQMSHFVSHGVTRRVELLSTISFQSPLHQFI
jgi:hypothetical protein